MQGYGGEYKMFDLQRNQFDYQNNCQLALRKQDNNTNAYMLIYVRDAERSSDEGLSFNK